MFLFGKSKTTTAKNSSPTTDYRLQPDKNIKEAVDSRQSAVSESNVRPHINFVDAIAPEELEVDFSFLRINNSFYRTFFVSNYPRYVEPNWLEPLISFDHSLIVSMFIYPSTAKGVLDDLKRKIAEMEATIQSDLERNKEVDPAVQVALDDARALQEQLVKGAERFFQLGLYVTVPAPDKEELDNISKLVQSTLGSLSITARSLNLQMEEGFKTTLPLGVDYLGLKHNMDTTSLATTFPFTSSELTSNTGIMYGINVHNDSLIIFDRFGLENANSVLFAKSGSGKSLSRHEMVLFDDGDGVKLSQIGPLIEGLISEYGAQPIEKDIEGVINPKLKVWTFDQNLKGQWSDVSVGARKKFSPRNRLYEITTKSGRQITVTADHNLVILRKGKIRVTRSEAIRVGEAIPLTRRVGQLTNSSRYIVPKDIISSWPANLPQQLYLDKPLLCLLGLITSEGHITPKTLQIYNTDTAVLDLIKKYTTVLGLKISPLYNYPKRDIRGFHIQPLCFAKVVIAMGAGGLSGEKRVPSILFSLSNEQVARYLRAYYEGDGGVETNQVCATTKSKGLASDLAYLLLRFGIIARIRPRQKRATNTVNQLINTYYQVTISGKDNLLKFQAHIGFLTEAKNNKLDLLLAKPTVANTNIDTIPTLQPIFKYLHKTLFSSSEISSPANLVALKNGVFDPSPAQLKEFIADCEKRLKELRSLANHIQLLRSLPSLSTIIKRGSSSRRLNRALWQALGQSWRIMKNLVHPPLMTNALLAYQTISGQVIALPTINNALYSSFKYQGLSLREYDKSLWASIVTRKTGNSSFNTIVGAAGFVAKKYRSTQLKIRHVEKKLSELKQLANADLFWDPIVKIERIKHREKYVYDLQVNNGVFLAGYGGMFVHNSYMVKLEALRSMMFGTEIIVIDPEQEYLDLCRAVGGDYVNFSTNSPVKINPFDLSQVATSGENELGRKILTLTGFLKLVLGQLDAGQSAILDRAISTTYRLKGITADPASQQLTPPLMEDLYKVLAGMEEPQAVELAFRLERFVKGSLSGIFSGYSNINLNNQFTVFSVRDLADQLRPLAMYLILDYIWTKIRMSLKRRILVVDEAWYMMKQEDSASFLTEIAKRARKYYLGVTTITQDVEDFLAQERGKEIISNSSIQVLLKQAPSSIERVGQTFNLSEGEKRLLLAAGIGQGLIFVGPTHVAMRVVASPEEHQLITSNPQELLERQAKAAEQRA